MSNYHNLLSTAAERGLDLHFQNVDGGNVSVTVLFEDDRAMSAASAASSPAPAAWTMRPPRSFRGSRPPSMGRATNLTPGLAKSIATGIVANTCGECGAPTIYGSDADEMITHCPACSNKRRGVERMSLNLRLSLVQGTLDEIAAEASPAMSIALIPVLAELAQINEMLAEPVAA